MLQPEDPSVADFEILKLKDTLPTNKRKIFRKIMTEENNVLDFKQSQLNIHNLNLPKLGNPSSSSVEAVQKLENDGVSRVSTNLT